MDNNYICPKCGNRKWKVTRKGNRIKCTANATHGTLCTYVSPELTPEEINNYLTYVPIPPTNFELCMEEIQKASMWIDEWGVPSGDYIPLDELEDILKKYIKEDNHA